VCTIGKFFTSLLCVHDRKVLHELAVCARWESSSRARYGGYRICGIFGIPASFANSLRVHKCRVPAMLCSLASASLRAGEWGMQAAAAAAAAHANEQRPPAQQPSSPADPTQTDSSAMQRTTCAICMHPLKNYPNTRFLIVSQFVYF
jgi:hypothetical protein